MNLLRFGLVLIAMVSTFVVKAQENVNALIKRLMIILLKVK